MHEKLDKKSLLKSTRVGVSLALTFFCATVGVVHCETPVAKGKQMSSSSEPLRQADRALLIDCNYSMASNLYRQLADKDRTGEAQADLIIALAKQGEISQACNEVLKARRLFPDNLHLKSAEAVLSYLISQKDIYGGANKEKFLTNSERLCTSVLFQKPDDFFAQQTIGQIWITKKEYKSAENALRKSLAVMETPEGLVTLAQVLRAIDASKPEIPALLTKAKAMNKRYAPAYFQLARLFDEQNKTDEALKELQAIPAGCLDSASAVLEGELLAKGGDDEKAISFWHDVLNKEPEFTEVRVSLANSLIRRGQADLAVDVLLGDAEKRLFSPAIARALSQIALNTKDVALRKRISQHGKFRPPIFYQSDWYGILYEAPLRKEFDMPPVSSNLSTHELDEYQFLCR